MEVKFSIYYLREKYGAEETDLRFDIVLFFLCTFRVNARQCYIDKYTGGK